MWLGQIHFFCSLFLGLGCCMVGWKKEEVDGSDRLIVQGSISMPHPSQE
jgi:hypothetical protein